jgi:hypothetical protein
VRNPAARAFEPELERYFHDPASLSADDSVTIAQPQ